jgi:hypothetical protein
MIALHLGGNTNLSMPPRNLCILGSLNLYPAISHEANASEAEQHQRPCVFAVQVVLGMSQNRQADDSEFRKLRLFDSAVSVVR